MNIILSPVVRPTQYWRLFLQSSKPNTIKDIGLLPMHDILSKYICRTLLILMRSKLLHGSRSFLNIRVFMPIDASTILARCHGAGRSSELVCFQSSNITWFRDRVSGFLNLCVYVPCTFFCFQLYKRKQYEKKMTNTRLRVRLQSYCIIDNVV